jgi:hypothetical protein
MMLEHDVRAGVAFTATVDVTLTLARCERSADPALRN